MKRRRVVFLMSDTGAGHRSAADAIRAALERRYPGEYACELVDVYRRYTPFPFCFLPEIYPRWVNRARRSWVLSYRLADGRCRGALIMSAFSRLWRDGLRRMVAEHPGDVYVAVHALFSRPVMDALERTAACRPPFVTVVTDLVTTHAFWYEGRVERCLVPTRAAYERGLAFGLMPDQLRITGLPIHPRFIDHLLEKAQARRALGLHPTLPAVLLAGGGEGMGPVFRIAVEINRRRLPVQLVVVAGRNRALQRRLGAVAWNQPTLVYPFVNNMPELMAAADVLVTKAGPTTIGEACLAGLPMILSGAVPGQEDGNVAYVVENGAGAYAPGPDRVADTLTDWLAQGSAALEQRAEQARRLGCPQAVWQIAEEVRAQAQRVPVRTSARAVQAARRPFLRDAPDDGWAL